MIGNGSVGVVYVDVYDTKMGVGSRLSGVQVIDHVVFESEGSGGVSAGIQPKNYYNSTPSATPAPSKSTPGDIPF